jgi:DNA polymerase-3 subunit gamma/tau
MEAVAKRDVSSVLLSLDEIIMLGKDVRQVLQELALHGRSLLLYKAAPDIDAIEMYSADKKILAEQAVLFSYEELAGIMQIFNEAINEIKWADEPRIAAEMALIKACRRSFTQDVADLAQRVAQLENRLKGTTVVATAELAAQAQTPRREKYNHKEQLGALRQQQQEHAAKPKPQAVTIHETSLNEQSEEDYAAYDLKDVWENVLKEILNSGKRAAYACVQQGKLISIDNGQAVLQFNVQFPKERTEKEDYRTIIENIFLKVCGRPLRLSCILGSDSNPKPPQAASNLKPKGESHPVLQQAVKMFGGKVIKQENDEEV